MKSSQAKFQSCPPAWINSLAVKSWLIWLLFSRPANENCPCLYRFSLSFRHPLPGHAEGDSKAKALIDQILAGGREGRGNRKANGAWRGLVRLGPGWLFQNFAG